MPNLATRTEHERRLAAAILLLLQDGGLADLEQRIATSREVVDELAAVYEEAAEQLIGQSGATADWEDVTRRAAAWAQEHARKLAAAVAENSRRALAGPGGGAVSDAVFGAERAATIAITEVTRALSAGEASAALLLASTGGEVMEPYWYTEADARVCEVCAPLHGQPRDLWDGRFPGGPPAHPRCRCWLTWR